MIGRRYRGFPSSCNEESESHIKGLGMHSIAFRFCLVARSWKTPVHHMISTPVHNTMHMISTPVHNTMHDQYTCTQHNAHDQYTCFQVEKSDKVCRIKMHTCAALDNQPENPRTMKNAQVRMCSCDKHCTDFESTRGVKRMGSGHFTV
jgi:hypothetical protein